jgi:chemotaxis protein MotB
VLTKVGQLIATVEYDIRIEGHTDNWPISTVRFPSNWELSTGRAASVVRFFIENLGFSPKQLEAAGYGQERPIASNETAEGRQKNRRVDVLLLRPSLSEAEPAVDLEVIPDVAPL